MRLDKLTQKSKEALAAAQALASQKGQPEITPEHILRALAAEADGTVAALLQRAGRDVAAFVAALDQEIDRLPRQSGALEIGLSRQGKNLIEGAEREADKLHDQFTSTEHFLLAAAHGDFGAASRLLKQAGLDHAGLLQLLAQVRGNQRVVDENPEGADSWCAGRTVRRRACKGASGVAI